MSRTEGGFGDSTKHLGQLERARLAGQPGEAGERAAVLDDLLHLKVLVSRTLPVAADG